MMNERKEKEIKNCSQQFFFYNGTAQHLLIFGFGDFYGVFFSITWGHKIWKKISEHSNYRGRKLYCIERITYSHNI